MLEDRINLGHKRICPLCSAKYYDFYQEEVNCPSCGKIIQATNINKPKRGRKASTVTATNKNVKENDDLKDLIDGNGEDDAIVVQDENLDEDISIDIKSNKEKDETN